MMRSHGGDGLGPVYNDSSCVACHNAGGSGGGGPVSKNIDILNASLQPALFVKRVTATGSGTPPAAALDPLLAFHAGFKTSRTVVLHKFGTDPSYDSWRGRALQPAVANAQSITSITDGEMLSIAKASEAQVRSVETELRLANTEPRTEFAENQPG